MRTSHDPGELVVTVRGNRLEAPLAWQSTPALFIHAGLYNGQRVVNRRLSLSDRSGGASEGARARRRAARARGSSDSPAVSVRMGLWGRQSRGRGVRLAPKCAWQGLRGWGSYGVAAGCPQAVHSIGQGDDAARKRFPGRKRLIEDERQFRAVAHVGSGPFPRFLGYGAAPESGFFKKQSIFPPIPRHNHGSCVVQTKGWKLVRGVGGRQRRAVGRRRGDRRGMAAARGNEVEGESSSWPIRPAILTATRPSSLRPIIRSGCSGRLPSTTAGKGPC